MTPIRMTAGLLPLLAAAAAVVVAGCGTAQPAASQGPGTAMAARPARTVVAAGSASAGWAAAAGRAVPRGGPAGVTFSQVTTEDGSLITMATFRGPAQYALHNGSGDPGPLAGPVTAGPKVTGTERERLLAAFNGGFKLDALAGGYEQEGHVVRALRQGLASLVIDTSGQASVGVWGRGLPVKGEAVYSVRQNLWALVSNGKPTAESALWWRWSGTLGHAEYAPRSARTRRAS